MGKPTGFLEYERQDNPTVMPKERIKNFNEFHTAMDTDKRREQASRCMNCGVPFCQSGVKFGGMFSGCPLHNLIPEFNDCVYNGHDEEALHRLLKSNPFPEFTGRVCPALCEAACTCGLNDTPVTVRDNELYIIETAYKNGFIKPAEPPMRSGKRVAVIGSGPAGLAVAHTLNRRGHSVTVFERNERPGGLLMYGIPNMKLDKSAVYRRIELMKSEGVEFVCCADVGADKDAKKLISEFDATVICTGAKKPRSLAGCDVSTKGVSFAVDFLSDATRTVIGEKPVCKVDAGGKNVVIVGGGDTGNDCVGTCIRQGCKSVCQLEITPEPPHERTKSNPWPQWPRICKTDYGQSEAIALFGADPRIFETTVEELITDENGALKAVKTVKVAFEKDAKTGKSLMKKTENSERVLDCDLLLIAAGFVGGEDYIFDSFGLKKNERGNVLTKEDEYMCGEGLFTAGDAHRGQSLVVWAISEGIHCAEAVDRYLMSC